MLLILLRMFQSCHAHADTDVWFGTFVFLLHSWWFYHVSNGSRTWHVGDPSRPSTFRSRCNTTSLILGTYDARMRRFAPIASSFGSKVTSSRVTCKGSAWWTWEEKMEEGSGRSRQSKSWLWDVKLCCPFIFLALVSCSGAREPNRELWDQKIWFVYN